MTRRAPRVEHLVVALAVLPFVLGAVAALRADWHPPSDFAILEARVRDVGGGHTPLTGPFSRYGFDHPGPLLYYVLAVPYRLSGDDPRGLLLGAVVVNACAAATVARIACTRSVRFGLAAVGALSVLVWSLAWEQSAVLSPWNPYVAVLPYVAFLFACWRVADGSAPALVAAVVAGTWSVHGHVGYLLLVGAAAAVALAAGARRIGWRSQWRWVAGAAIGAMVLWAPVLADQVGGTGNLSEIVAWSREPAEEPIGVFRAVAIAGRQLAPRSAWSGADGSTDGFGSLVEGATWELAVPVVALALVLATALRRRDRSMVHLASLTAVSVAVGLVGLSRVTGIVAAYVVLWIRPLAMLVWLLAVWAVWAWVGPSLARRLGPARQRSLDPVITGGIAGGAVAATLAASVATASMPPPNDSDSRVVGLLADRLAAEVDRASPVVIRSTGNAYLALGAGVQMELERRGFEAFEPRPPPGSEQLGTPQLGAHRRLDVDGRRVLVVVSGPDVDAALADPASEVVVHVVDPPAAIVEERPAAPPG